MNQPGGIIVKHTNDKMKAFVALTRNVSQANAGMVLAELLRHGIAHGLDTAMIHKLVGSGLYDKYVEVAHGTQAAPGTDGRLERLVDTQGEPELVTGADGVPMRLPHALVAVEANTPLVRRIPPVKGTDGMDVFGAALPAPPVKEVELLAGDGVAAAQDDPDTLIALRAGTLNQTADGVIEVRPFLDIKGDVSCESGNVFFDGDLMVGGAVRSGVRIEIGGTLVINGDVSEAEIVCGGDLTIRGTVSGGGKAIIEAGGCARITAIDKSVVVVEGDLIVDEYLNDSDVRCKGALKARGIVGGSVTVTGGVCAVTIGDAAGTPTVVDIGAVHAYAQRRENIKSSIATQNNLIDDYVTELFSFVRDNMDELGEIGDDMLPRADELTRNLKDAIAIIAELEKDKNEIDEQLKAIENCCISASEVYTNVQLKLGFSEQYVREVLKNILLRPAVVKSSDE